MAAGLGYKEFTTGDVLTAADANGYLASQVVMVFADAAARTAAITTPEEGMISFLKDTNSTEYYSGAAWVAIGGGGGVTFEGSSVYKSATQSIPHDTTTVVTWNSENYDTNSFHSTSVDTGRFTIPTAGKYLINVVIGWDTTGSTVNKNVNLRKNGTTILGHNGNGTGSSYQTISFQYTADAAVSDYFDITVYQPTGSSLNILNNAASTFQISYLGE
jgi:hypothetical protein